MGVVSEYLKSMLDAVFPPICLICERLTPPGKSGSEFCVCERCIAKLTYFPGFFCPVCKRRLPGGEADCHRQAGFILAAPFSFEDKRIQKIIHLLKYQGVKKAAKPLAFFMSKYLMDTSGGTAGDDFLMLPIPIHRSKERRRGFNQSKSIAEWAAFYLNTGGYSVIELRNDVLVKTRKNKTQTKLKSYKDRKKNVENSFEVIDPGRVKDRNVIVIDDVFTSGATMREAVRAIKKSGGGKVIALVAAKT